MTTFLPQAQLKGLLGKDDTSLVVDRLVAAFNNDPHLFFDRLKQRFNVVGLQFPKVEIRFEHLEVNAFVQAGTRALPTIPNFVFNMSEAFMRRFGIFRGERMNMSILNDVSGIIRPSRKEDKHNSLIKNGNC
ncbi:ABC transporter G family member 32-like [Silene latifolia]|uniref:ABC transporter G family member 32-like n=1 Tax=Silene latifolia TaxID=37657 RepID=UPI003D7782D3